MSRTQQSRAAVGAARGPLWQTAPGQPLKLPAAPGARWLRVREGELWITADGRRGAPPPDDWWLSAGECLRLPSGTAVLLEGWPMARFELLEEPRRTGSQRPARPAVLDAAFSWGAAALARLRRSGPARRLA